MNHKIISVIFVLAFASLACGFSIDLPDVPAPGPEVTDEISVTASTSRETRLTLSFGAGELHLSPGGEGKLVEGTATYNIKDFKPEIIQDDNEVQIKQGDYEFSTAPTLRNLKNVWDLKLGDSPMLLIIEAGAYKGKMDLGGLSLTGLTIQDGAADVELSFSSPNQTGMSVFRYETGASNVTLEGLANANFQTMIFTSGAGNYTLDFTGDLQRDATVSIESGLSNMTLLVPGEVNANVTVENGLANVSAGSGWTHKGNIYTREGSGPTLTFVIKMNAGNLTLTD